MEARTHDRVVAVIEENGASLLRIARMHSMCADDAQDAYQRTLEIFLERIDQVHEATAGSWLRTVCKHESMRIRAARQRLLPHDAIDFDLRPSTEVGDAGERMAGRERVERAAEALQRCKPDEVRALLMKADGSSYVEIAEELQWTYTKVNRCLTEGRARFLRLFAEIEDGAACERWAPVLSAIVDGEATPDDFAAVRPHLRHCAGCRATLRALYEAEPALRALVPVGAVSGGGFLDSLLGAFGDRIVKAQHVVEAVTSSKAAAVMASTAVVATGSAAAPAQPPPQARAGPQKVVREVETRPARSAPRVVPRVVVARRVQRRASATTAPPTPPPARSTTPAPRAEFAFEARTPPKPPRARPSRPRVEFSFEG